MSLLSDLDTLDAQGKPGDWAFVPGKQAHGTANRLYIAIRLTEAEDGMCIIPIVQAHEQKPLGTAWLWDGNREAPTLTPSILHHSKPSWHGYLTAGKLVTV